jgi:hypothetical protein
MSMLGLSVGTTPSATSVRSRTQRASTAFSLDPMISCSSGAPDRRAIQPARMLPKLPLGTATRQRPSAAATRT